MVKYRVFEIGEKKNKHQITIYDVAFDDLFNVW